MNAPETQPAQAPARERLLDAARRLMLEKGYAAAGVEQICAAAGVSKGSFFHHFDGKEAVALEVLDRFVAARFQEMRQVMGEAGDDPLARVYRLLDYLADQAPEAVASGGCLIGTFAQELAHTHPALREACDARFRAWTGALAADLEAARPATSAKQPLDARSLADHLVAVFEGALLMAKARRDPAVVSESLGHFKRYLRELYGR